MEALLRSPVEIEAVLTTGEADLNGPIADLAARRRIRVRRITAREARQLFYTRTPQGVAALARVPAPVPLDELLRTGRRLLVLDQVNDPGNAGTLVRTAHLMGWDAVVTTPRTVSLFHEKTARASAGAIGFLRHAAATPDEIAAQARDAGWRVLLADVGPGIAPPPARAPERVVLVLGNEACGAAAHWPGCERIGLATVESPIDSLSVATAGSILLYLLR